jgi:hypothetical protein
MGRKRKHPYGWKEGFTPSKAGDRGHPKSRNDTPAHVQVIINFRQANVDIRVLLLQSCNAFCSTDEIGEYNCV